MVYCPNLESLHADMKQHGETRAKFDWDTHRNGAHFRVVFLSDMEPMVLLFALVGGTFAFEFELDCRYGFRAYMGEQHQRLREVLGIRGYNGEVFSMNALFDEFAEQIPTNFHTWNRVTYRDIPRIRSVEDADRIYFCGWRNNGGQGNVSPQNLEKTLLLLGREAFGRCRAGNISSCWTDDPGRAMAYDLPD